MEAVESIFAVARSNDLPAVQSLLEELTTNSKGFNVNLLVDETTQNTLMHVACSNGNLNACKYLFMNGMYLNEPNKRGHTPLFYAADCGNLSLVKWMVSNGADIDTDYSSKVIPSSSSGEDRRYDVAYTPLQAACVKGHIEIVDFLVECNADLGGCALNGVTPLHFACHQSQRAIAKVLLEAGADMHASDSAGTSAMDLASGTIQSFLTAYDEHGTFEDDDAPLETSRQALSDGPEISRILPESISKAFGASVARQLASAEWKVRQQAIQEMAIVMQQNSASKHFDAACEVLLLAAKDSVAQVFSTSMPLLKGTFNVVLSSAQFHTPAYHSAHPLIGDILDLLLVRAAGAHEREASEAVTSLLFLACKSVQATQRIISTIQEHMSRSNAWRQQLVYIRLLTAIASQYRFAEESGFAFEDAMKVSAQSMEHSSVKVRTASIDLLVQSVLITSEASGLQGQPDEISDHVISFADSLVQKFMGSLKPSLLANIHKGLKSALGNSRRLSETSRTPGKQPVDPNTKLKILDKKDEYTDADLPYAEPVQDQFKDQAEGLISCFGDKVTRCLFSNAWAPRVEGFSYLQKLLESKQCPLTPAAVSAFDVVLQSALGDRVNAVYEAGIALLMEFVLAYGASLPSSAKQLQDCLRPLIPRLVLKLGDSKARLQVVSEDALLFLSRQPLAGPVFLLDAMPSLNAPSAALLANKLNLIVKLMLEFGVHESGALNLKHVLQPAISSCENKDPAVRQAAVQIFAEAFKVARQATMPYLNGLARSAKQKLISKLVELGVLESDLLMDEVDDFDVDTTAARPSTSGARPPTASGSSTKHRPNLSSVSVLAPTSSSSTASSDLPYGTALTDEQRTEYSRMIQVIGEPIVRCLLDKTWAPREAAVREIERLIAESLRKNDEVRLGHDAPTLIVLSEALELVLNDTVARVYQCALRLLQVVATDFVPCVPGHELVLTSTLKPAIEAVILKLGDSKQRIRSDSYAVLHALANLPHIGGRLVGTFLLEQLNADGSGVSPVAMTEMLMLMTSLLRESLKPDKSSSLDLAAILQAVVPALENKHVDIRNAAVAAYTALYEVTKASSSTVDVHGCLTNLKPTVREAITKNILQLQKLQPSIADTNQDTPEVESARSTHDMEKVVACFGDDIAFLLTSALASKRRQGLHHVLSKLTSGKMASQKKQSTPVWEVCCLLAKTMLLDAAVAVVLVVFQLLQLVTTSPDAVISVPWGEWGVHLILGSTIRSVLQQAAHSAVRVRHAVKQLLQVVVHRHSLGRTVVSTAVLSVPEETRFHNTSTQTTRNKRLDHLRLGWQLVLRLEVIDEMLQENPTDLLCVENVVPFLGTACLKHGSVQVVEWTQTILLWFNDKDAQGLTKVLQGSSSSIQRKLTAVLHEKDSTNEENQSGNCVVRTSRASHVRRIAALRPPRSVPLDETKSLGNCDIRQAPQSARDGGGSLDYEDDYDNGKENHHTIQAKPMGSVPLWLSDKKAPSNHDVDDMDGDSMTGTSGLLKARRKSREGRSRNNNHEDDDSHERRVYVGRQQQSAF